jgi:hypothetical protein
VNKAAVRARDVRVVKSNFIGWDSVVYFEKNNFFSVGVPSLLFYSRTF